MRWSSKLYVAGAASAVLALGVVAFLRQQTPQVPRRFSRAAPVAAPSPPGSLSRLRRRTDRARCRCRRSFREPFDRFGGSRPASKSNRSREPETLPRRHRCRPKVPAAPSHEVDVGF